MGRRVHRALLPVAREHDVVLGLENHYKDGFWKYPEFAQKQDVFLELLEAIPDRDSLRRAVRPLERDRGRRRSRSSCCVMVADRVVSMHASDRYLAEGATLEELRQTDGTLGYSPNLRHGVTGKGLNDYDAIFRILAEHGYPGWISIEDGMNGMDEMAESLAFLRRSAHSTSRTLSMSRPDSDRRLRQGGASACRRRCAPCPNPSSSRSAMRMPAAREALRDSTASRHSPM